MNITHEIQEDLQKLIEDAYRVSRDTGRLVEEALQASVDEPLSKEEAKKLLTTVIDKLKSGAQRRGDKTTVKKLETDVENIIQQAMDVRESLLRPEQTDGRSKKVVILSPFNGVTPATVHPRPTFHRREVAMRCGGVKTTDISLWDKNERLDIHVSQFKAEYGRDPNSSELLDIMLSKMPLLGLSGKDQFAIVDLARSIANNGVQRPPIIDIDGTLYDGNRRVTACYYILHSDEFDTEQKKRAENIFVWQFTEYATDDDKQAVVVALNFEPDSKQDWPEYVKAKIIYQEWQAMLAREGAPPGSHRLAEMKRLLSNQFGYGEDHYMVNRYIRMVDWASEFEDHEVNVKREDPYAVKHQASRYFQYFDEISVGTKPGGVAHTLNQDEPFKHLVYDLLFQGKFKNWSLIRNLKHYNDDVREAMSKARDMNDIEEAQDLIEDKLNEAKGNARESRIGNPNQRIDIFTRWLENVPIGAFRDAIDREKLKKLVRAVRLVDAQVKELDIEKE